MRKGKPTREQAGWIDVTRLTSSATMARSASVLNVLCPGASDDFRNYEQWTKTREGMHSKACMHASP